MATDYGAAQPIADWVNSHVYTPVQRILGAVDKLPPSKKNDPSWHDEMVRKANQAFQAKSAESKPASKAKDSPPKYHKGTDYVPKTGPAVLEKGEAVLKKKDADKYRAAKGKDMAKDSTRAHSVLGGSHKSKSKSKHKGKKPHSIHIRRGKSGGFIATHHHLPDEDGVTPESEDHVVPDMSALHDHMDQMMGDQGAAPVPAPPPDAAAAAAGGGPGPGAGAPPPVVPQQ